MKSTECLYQNCTFASTYDTITYTAKMLLLFYVLSAIIIFQLTLPFLTVVMSRLVGRERLTPQSGTVEARDYACIITAYKNAAIAIPLVESLLKQSDHRFHIYLVADECPADFSTGIQDNRLTVLLPNPPLRLKVKSIIHATEHFVRKHNYIAIFDADNLVHPDFLKEIDRYAAAGHRTIQGLRTAKNTDNHFAAADSLGELYKNYIERYAPYLLGSSSVISGSGMATETQLYMAYLNSPEIQQGQYLGKRMLQEDKILQNFLLKRGETIVYARQAVCYDEKVQTGEAVETQRSRWLFSYFQNLPNTLQILGKGLFSFNWNQFFFGLVTLSLPMFIQLGVAFVLFLVGILLAPAVSVAIVAAVGIFATTVFWTLSLFGEPGVAARALSAIPAFIWRQARALLKMSNPDKNFKHTEHTQFVKLEDVLEKDKKEQ